MKLVFPPILLQIKKYLSFGNIFVFWYRHYKIPVFIGFLIIATIGGWNYYYDVFRYHFSDEEKSQYIDSYFKETAFNEEKFQSVVNGLRERARIHDETFVLDRNIFTGK